MYHSGSSSIYVTSVMGDVQTYTDASGKMIVGGTAKYVYGKAK